MRVKDLLEDSGMVGVQIGEIPIGQERDVHLLRLDGDLRRSWD